MSGGLALAKHDPVLIRLDRARTALAECKTIQEAKQIADLAGAAEIYARQQGMSDEIIADAHAVKFEALRRVGEMLAETKPLRAGPKHSTGGGSKGSKRDPLPDAPPTLAEIGLTKRSANVARKLHALPKKQFEAVRSGETKLTEATRAVVRQDAMARHVAMPTGKFRVIYADPPWNYGNTMPDGTTEQRDHYPVMKLADICAMPIREIAEKDAVLFLWVTSPILEESFQVIRAWGFSYKASFVWDKDAHNMGHYNSVRHEFLLVCTRGACTPDVRKLFPSVVSEKRTKHSRKPEQFYNIIETLYTFGAKIELFARGEVRKGWEVYGNQSGG